MLRLNLQTEAMGNLRFAYSPLVELTVSYRVLRGNRAQATYARWMEEARQAISDLSLPYMDVLITPGHMVKTGRRSGLKGYIPDFLTPTPPHPILDIESEFARIQALPPDLIRGCIEKLMVVAGPVDILCDFLAHPYAGMQALVAELREYWNRTLAHHWNRMVSVLENDILYHSRMLTLNGIESLLPALNEVINYEAGAITLGFEAQDCDIMRNQKPIDVLEREPDVTVDLKSDKFHLVPVIFSAHGIYFQIEEPWQPMILYSSRGAGLWNYETPEPSEALEMVIGAGKSRILMALASPFSTGELAQKLSLTSGAVSQQLGKLHEAGLVEHHRSGKRVFYRLSQKGTQLLDLFS